MPHSWFDPATGDPFDRWEQLHKSLPAAEQRTKAPRSPPPPPSPPSAPQRSPVSRKPVQHTYKHGDWCEFQHGRIVGRGKIVGSTMSYVIVKDAAGVEHRVQHSALLPPEGPDIDEVRRWV